MSALVRGIVEIYAVTKCKETFSPELAEAIDLDRACEQLVKNGNMSDMERRVLGEASLGHSVNTGARELGISRWLYARKLRSACRKIAEYLGWEYSDAYIKNVVERRLGRKLTQEEQTQLRGLLRIYAPHRHVGAIIDA